MNKFLSVIVPVYNTEQYLEECLNSILAQDNLEIIIVDDGSTDRSGVICDEYANREARVKVIHIENSGVSNARNIGLSLAEGEYILFLDSDDYLDQNQFKHLYNVLEKINVDFLLSGFAKINNDGKTILEEKNNFAPISSEELCCSIIYGTTKVAMGSFFVRAEIAKSFQFNTHTKYGEDLEYIYKCILKSNFVKVKQGHLLYYRQHNLSAISKMNTDRFDVYWARKRIGIYVRDHYQEYEKLLNAIHSFNIPEAIAKTLELNCYYGTKYKVLSDFVNHTEIGDYIKENDRNPKIAAEFTQIFTQWVENPRKYYLRQRRKNRIYTLKRRIYLMIYGKNE